MRVLPRHFDPEWAHSEAFPEVRFLMEPASGRNFEWAISRAQRLADADYEPEATETVTPVTDGPNAGKLSVIDNMGFAYDLARACLKEIEGAEDADGKFELELEQRSHLGEKFQVVKPECFRRLPMLLRAEIMATAGKSATLSAEEISGVGFTSASADSSSDAAEATQANAGSAEGQAESR